MEVTIDEILLGWWDTHKGNKRIVYNVILRYAQHYSISRDRFKELMSILGKALSERKAFREDKDRHNNQERLFKGGV